MLQKGRFPVESTISASVPFQEAGAALQAWSQSPESFAKILVEVGQVPWRDWPARLNLNRFVAVAIANAIGRTSAETMPLHCNQQFYEGNSTLLWLGPLGVPSACPIPNHCTGCPHIAKRP